MHAVLLTLMTFAGSDPGEVRQVGLWSNYISSAFSSRSTSSHATASHSDCGCQDTAAVADESCQECNDCGACDSCRARRVKSHRAGMPQTCYNPVYGCYPSTRFMHRYPAFAGYYYRRPYNYRHMFDYPWHAELHEPTSHFSYNVVDEEYEVIEGDVPPAPPQEARSLPRPSLQPVKASAQPVRATMRKPIRAKVGG